MTIEQEEKIRYDNYLMSPSSPQEFLRGAEIFDFYDIEPEKQPKPMKIEEKSTYVIDSGRGKPPEEL